MINKCRNLFIYTGLLVSLTSLSLAYTLYLIFSRRPDPWILLIIFTGTMFIYNTDHLRGTTGDYTTDLERVEFIENNRLSLYVLTSIIFLISVILVITRLDMYGIAILTPVFILGLLHRKLKQTKLPGSLYITVSWIVVVIIFPLSENLSLEILWHIVIIAPALFSNAYSYTTPSGSTGTGSVILLCIVSFAGILCAFLSPTRFLPLVSIPLLTMICILLLRRSIHYKYFYLDGSLFAGSALSILMIQF